MVKNLPAMWETQVQSLGRGNPMEKRMVVLVAKSLPVNAGDIRDAGLIPGSGRSPGGGPGNTLRYSCLENRMDRGAWRDTVPRVAKSWTWLKQLITQACTGLHTFS